MSLIDLISSQLGSQEVSKIGIQIGADENKTQSAISAALPMILGALSRNTSKEGGAESLAGALERDHDGSILENLGGLISNPEQSAGNGILKHILGQKRPAVEQAVGAQTGLDANSISKLMVTLAPMIMGVLGKQKKEQNLDAGALAGMLQGERQQQEENPKVNTNIVTSLLDRDGDGDIMDDIGGLIGGFFGGK